MEPTPVSTLLSLLPAAVLQRILSGVLAYVDGVACLSYLAMACVPLFFLRDSQTGSPLWLMRYAGMLVAAASLPSMPGPRLPRSCADSGVLVAFFLLR